MDADLERMEEAMKRRVGLPLLMMLATAGMATAGMRYESVMITYNEKGKAQSTMRVEAWVDGDNARIEFRELDGPQAKGSGLDEDGYLVSTNGGETLFFVNPDEKTYMEWDLAGMMSAASAIMNSSGGMLSIEFDNAEVEDLGRGPGESMHGLATTTVKRRTSYDMRMSIMGMKRAYHVDSEQEMWLTTEIPDVGFGAWMRSDPPKTGNAGFDEMIAMQATGIEGTPLRSITLNRTTDTRKGRTEVTRTVQEVTSIEEVEVDPGRFVIPSSYERVEMPAMGGGARDGDDEDQPKGLGGLLRGLGG
jgi:hypothetical protein